MQEPVSSAAFFRGHDGRVRISLSDPTYVHSDAVVIDPSTLCVFAILYESPHYLGPVSKDMAEAFSRSDHVILSAMRPDGSVFELSAPICARRSGQCGCCGDVVLN